MSQNVELRGFDQVRTMLDRLTDLRPAKQALRAGALHVMGLLQRYPPATVANSPSNVVAVRRRTKRGRRTYTQNRWYERGYGPRWARKRQGGVGGRRTSETLNRRWTMAARDDGLTQVVGNNVFYGPYVQGDEDQAAFHAARGWQTVGQVAEAEAETVTQFVADQIDKAMAGG